MMATQSWEPTTVPRAPTDLVGLRFTANCR